MNQTSLIDNLCIQFGSQVSDQGQVLNLKIDHYLEVTEPFINRKRIYQTVRAVCFAFLNNNSHNYNTKKKNKKTKKKKKKKQNDNKQRSIKAGSR